MRPLSSKSRLTDVNWNLGRFTEKRISPSTSIYAKDVDGAYEINRQENTGKGEKCQLKYGNSLQIKVKKLQVSWKEGISKFYAHEVECKLCKAYWRRLHNMLYKRNDVGILLR